MKAPSLPARFRPCVFLFLYVPFNIIGVLGQLLPVLWAAKSALYRNVIVIATFPEISKLQKSSIECTECYQKYMWFGCAMPSDRLTSESTCQVDIWGTWCRRHRIQEHKLNYWSGFPPRPTLASTHFILFFRMEIDRRSKRIKIK